ncbi:MAG: hypothetical protein LLG97_08930 [Deltaproteobacteria bacterium]|nr:hypothetical protein [Deltaproteobacteria bacterium]
MWHVALMDTGLYAWVLILFFRRSLSFRARTVSFVVILYIVGMILLLVVGPYSAGPVWNGPAKRTSSISRRSTGSATSSSAFWTSPIVSAWGPT